MSKHGLPRKNIGVLISGNGSNLKALHAATLKDDYPATITLVVSNKPDAPGLAWADAQDIATLALDHTRFRSREEFDDQIDRIMTAAKIDIIACAGFMRLMTPRLIENWHNKMINIHPSLLPLFKGLDTHARALQAGIKIAGCSVHVVRQEMDDGPILGQAAVPVNHDDTPQTLAARILKAEHKLYPQVLALFASDQIRIIDNRVVFAEGNTTRSNDNTIFSPALTAG